MESEKSSCARNDVTTATNRRHSGEENLIPVDFKPVRYHATSNVSPSFPIALLTSFACRKPKNASTKRLLEKRAPKVIENPKQAVFVRASTASAQTQAILADLVTPPPSYDVS